MVNIDTVYQRVLLLANKEQRGYITPEEFNSFAEQAQLEILDGYFAKRIAVDGIPGGDDEYSDAMMIVEERLKVFDTYTTIDSLMDMEGNHTSVFEYPTDQWQLGIVQVGPVVADEVSNRDAAFINLSPLTSPTNRQPVYSRRGNSIIVYPTQASIGITYLRKPLSPLWGYIDAMDGTPVYDSREYTPEQIVEGGDNIPAFGSQNFELHPGEETDLVYRILTLAGVAIKQQDIAQFGASKENQ